MLVEIISHCWSGPNGQYARLLEYQLNSLRNYPANNVDVMSVVVHAFGDTATEAVLEKFRDSEKLTIVRFGMERGRALQRPIGRNVRALCTPADVVVFADCDYLYLDGCIDSLAIVAGSQDGSLFYPTVVHTNPSQAHGDKYITSDHVLEIDRADFVESKVKKAIGGIQIVSGATARKFGYCNGISRLMVPAPDDCDTVIGFHGDTNYRRRCLKTFGTAIDIPNMLRIRHTQTGDRRAARAGLV